MIRSSLNAAEGIDFPVIFLAGTTASGKTELALKLAEEFPIDLVSVDSGQVYRGMDIGTAKPPREVLDGVPHALIDIRNLDSPYSAADFQKDAWQFILQSRSRGRIPLCVGGTLFYFSALLHGLSKMPRADAALRASLEQEARSIGWDALYERLRKLAPKRSEQIEPHDRQRILRALEVCELGGESGAATERSGGLIDADVPVLKLSLFMSDRAVLHERISHRFKRMLEQGFLEEVKNLRSAFPEAQPTPAMRSVGYQQAWHYLDGKISRQRFEEDAQTATRRLAKRQLTWLRNDPGWIWFDALNPGVIGATSRFLASAGCG